jgi:uncharacterized protein (TIGR03066 family)
LTEHDEFTEVWILKRSNVMASIAILIGLVLVLGLAGCKTETSPLVGTWKVSMGKKATPTGPTWQFTKDGKMIQSAGGTAVNAEATYSLSGDVLTLTTTADGQTQDSTMTVKWTSEDQFTGVIGGMANAPLTFTRQK